MIKTEDKNEKESAESGKEETEKEKRLDRKSTIFVLVAVASIVVVLSGLFVLQYWQKSGEKPNFPSVKYNNYVFYHVAENTLWQWDWQKGNDVYNLMLHYNPYEVENVPISGNLDDSFNTKQIYITFDPSEENTFAYIALAAGELSLSVNSALGAEAVAACSQNVTDACASRPIVTCYNSDKGIIYLKEDRETKLEMKGNCVVVQGTEKEIVRAADRLLYQWYGVMK